MNLSDQITALANPVVEKSGAFIVDVAIRGERRSKVIELFIDTDTGITSDQCVSVSRELSLLLDTEDIVSGSYQLVVSSPGLERPLKFLRQYKRNIGRNIEVKCKIDGAPGYMTGTLTEVSDQGIHLRLVTSGEAKEVVFGDIIEARIQSAW